MFSCLALIGMCVTAAPDAAEKPNIVLVMADDQGWGDMAYNGHERVKTPNFDRMAAEALRFDRYYAAAPVCSPTRGSVMTGRHPNRFGCFKWGFPLRPQEITVAEALKTAGYTTGHFGKWHLGSVRKGSPVNPGESGFDCWFSAENFYDNDAILSREGVAVQTEGESSMLAVDAAIDFIRGATAAKKPFLAVVWFGSPHSPHRAFDQDREPYKDMPQRMQHFLGEITGMDRAFGKLRAEIKDLGIRDNTILWYTSDNGALPKVGSTGGFRGHKGNIYEGGLLVPAILEWPPVVKRPRATDTRCFSSDIYPTLLDIVGVKMEGQPPLDGVSLKPLIEGDKQLQPRGLGFWDHPTRGISTPSAKWMADLLAAQQVGKELDEPERLRLDAGEIKQKYPEDSFPGHSAWIAGDWKLHRIESNGGQVKWELYNLADDRAETKDLAGEQPGRVEKMKADLEAWLLCVVRSLNGEDY